MNQNRNLTLQQERLVYRRAVKLTLERFFDRDSYESAQLVDAWWQGLGRGELFKTGLFMHDEPLNVAADLAGAERTPAVWELGKRYEQTLSDALPRLRPQKQLSKPVRQTQAA